MRTVGLIGGMSWHSTIDYYRGMNAAAAEAHGGHHSAPLLLSSLNFAEIRTCQTTENWERAGELLAAEARKLEAAGASAIAICTNLMHKVAPAVEAAVSVPLVHIVDAIATHAKSLNVTRLGVLGTDWTMRESFYRERLATHGIDAVIPDAPSRKVVDDIIWNELTKGVVTDASREAYRDIIARMQHDGAQAVVLGCTEIQLLICNDDVSIPVIDSLEAHVRALSAVMLDHEPAIA